MAQKDAFDIMNGLTGVTCPSRRNFLIRCCQGASAAFIPANLSGPGWPSLYAPNAADDAGPPPEFHVHPHYRMPRSLDALLLKTQAGLDDFVTEKYAHEIATILAQWSSGLLQSPQDVSPIARVLLPNFSGASPTPAESRTIRPGPPIEVRQNTFHVESALGREAFLQALRSTLSSFSKTITAEFQVTTIDAAIMPPMPMSEG